MDSVLALIILEYPLPKKAWDIHLNIKQLWQYI